MAYKKMTHGVEVAEKAFTPDTQEIFPENLLRLLTKLHHDFKERRLELLKLREERQAKWNAGELPTYENKNSPAVVGNWRVNSIPEDYRLRRVEITGPVSDRKMVINMLSRNEQGHRADTAMLDFEDSMKPSFDNVLNGYKNVIGAALGNLSFIKEGAQKKTYELDPSDMAGLMVRVRGLHLEESNFLIEGESIHGGLLDLVTCFFHTAETLIKKKKTPKYYIPKCEHYLEARWWSDLFKALESEMGFSSPTLRATFLIETLPAAFQIEEILYEGKEHIIGLNVGRWDKIFSDIKVLRNHKDKTSIDRSEINMSKYWMDNYAKRLIKICHTRGAYAIGGMSAFTPGKDPLVREAQAAKVRADKENEAKIGHDGCWVSHPYFIGHAMEAFTRDHQLEVILKDFDKYPNLIMDGVGPKTLEGLKTNIRVGIGYMQGWKNNLGCVSWDNLMEDLATLEISRAQVWQWMHHKVLLDTGEKVDEELVKSIFKRELEKINVEFPDLKESFLAAKEEAQRIFLRKELSSFLETKSELYR